MGWFWQSSAPAKPSAPQGSARQAQAPAPAPTPAQQPPQDSKSAPETDPEVIRFLEELMGELRSARKPTDQASSAAPPPPEQGGLPSQPQPSSPAETETKASSARSSWWTSSSSSPASSYQRTAHEPPPPVHTRTQTSSTSPAEPSLSPLAESLLPTSMDCEQAFNQAFYCQSLGGQWNSLYRYGTVRSCSENWDDFWFCMRVKSYSPGPVKENMIREHYRKKELAKYGPGKPSSIDVWRERSETVPPGTAFSAPAEAPAVSDEEFQRWEMERMDSIRNGASK